MQLLIVRHADAGNSEEFAKTGQPDHLRPLSKKGQRQMRSAVKGLLALVPRADVVVTSPYVRAVETSIIVANAYGIAAASETSDALEPERPPQHFEHWLDDRDAEVVIAVGHEPHLGTLATWLMTGKEDSRIALKKGGACLLRFDDRVAKGAGTLAWLMTARHLQALGEAGA